MIRIDGCQRKAAVFGTALDEEEQNMKKSYARRIMLSCSALILASILILDSILLLFVWQFFKLDKYDLLEKNVNMGLYAVQEYIEKPDAVDVGSAKPLLNVLAASIDAHVIVADKGGSFIIRANGGRNDDFVLYGNNSRIPVEMMQRLDEQKEIHDAAQFGGMYRIRCYTYATVITDAQGKQVGYIIASLPMELHLRDFMSQMIKICLTASVPVLILACIICYCVANQIAKPLRQAASVAQQYGKGDFAARLPVDSQDEIGVLMQEMNQMGQSLAANDSIQRSFIANVSHELKTPMTTISGFVDGILDGTIPKSKERYYLTLVSEEVKRLSRLVRSMLNLSKIEAGEMQPNKTDFNILDTVIRVVLAFEKKIEEHNIEIRGLDIDPLYVNADEDLVHQVVYNLVENAVKFTNENGYIAFDIYRKESRIFVGIQNSGLGLTKEELENVFKRFYKSDRSRGLDKTGFGLGLYIVRSIIAAHGGEVEVESIEGEYCRFTVSLPETQDIAAARGRRGKAK